MIKLFYSEEVRMKEINESINPIREKVKGRFQNHFSGFLRAFLVSMLVMFQFAIIIVLPFLFRSLTV